jgi:hypothetical protein
VYAVHRGVSRTAALDEEQTMRAMHEARVLLALD